MDGFWSITIYNAKGFFEAPENAISVNNETAKKDADGAVTVHFGGDPSQANFCGSCSAGTIPFASMAEGPSPRRRPRNETLPVGCRL